VLNLGHVASSMAIFRDGNLAAARARRTDGDADGPLLAGGNAFTQHIMSHRSLNSTDAERYKREQLFFLPDFTPEQEGISNYQMIKPAFRELVQGIFDVIEGYLVKFQEPRVDEIILTGGGANFQNLDVALAGQLKTRVIKGSSLISMVNPAGQELPEDLKNVLTPAVGGFCREN
jgi:Tfp pilus assembly PilM family ATPase